MKRSSDSSKFTVRSRLSPVAIEGLKGSLRNSTFVDKKLHKVKHRWLIPRMSPRCPLPANRQRSLHRHRFPRPTLLKARRGMSQSQIIR